MPRFYFHLKSKQTRIPDDKGKNLDTLNEAYEHGRKLVDKILQHVGYDERTSGKLLSLTTKTMLNWSFHLVCLISSGFEDCLSKSGLRHLATRGSIITLCLDLHHFW